jgi:hypothetical protein
MLGRWRDDPLDPRAVDCREASVNPNDLASYDAWKLASPNDEDDEEAMRLAMGDDDREPDEPEVCGQFYDGQ